MDHIDRLAARVEQGDGLTLEERRHAAILIRHALPPKELLDLGHNMLAASPQSLRWHAEQLAAKLGCSGPYQMGYAVQPTPANDASPGDNCA